MSVRFVKLPSAVAQNGDPLLSAVDGLPVRESGVYIDQKHDLLSYYSSMFAMGMRNKWQERVYMEVYAGPGRCLVRETEQEQPGSPLKVLDLDFTRFIFIEINTSNARALEQRVKDHPKAAQIEIWNGDNMEALDRIGITKGSLTFTFVDPTGLVEMDLLKKIRAKTPNGDLLINFMESMGIGMNLHQYKESSGQDCKLTRFLGTDSWKSLLTSSPSEQRKGIRDLFKTGLKNLGYLVSDQECPVTLKRSSKRVLYRLLFATGHQRGLRFWEKALDGADPNRQLFPLQ